MKVSPQELHVHKNHTKLINKINHLCALIGVEADQVWLILGLMSYSWPALTGPCHRGSRALPAPHTPDHVLMRCAVGSHLR